MLGDCGLANSDVNSGRYNRSLGASRILDIPCKVCGDFSSGKHYNIFACDGCAGFFKRSIRRNRQYTCKSRETCLIDKAHRNQCRACRLQRCKEAGMNKDAVQHERGPRNSTIRRAMTSYLEEHRMALASAESTVPPQMCNNGVLNLSLPRVGFPAPSIIQPHPIMATLPLMHTSPFGFLPRIPPIPFHHPSSPSMLATPPDSPPAPALSADEICEAAASLLFLNVQWTKSQKVFTSLNENDQLVLLEGSWKEVFVLSACQLLSNLDLRPLMERCSSFRADKSASFAQRVQEFQEVFLLNKRLLIDHEEYTLLRLLAIFTGREGEARLMDANKVNLLFEEVKLNLHSYLIRTKPHEPARFGHLLALLLKARIVLGDDIKELFFEKAVGSVSMVKVIADMYKNYPESKE